MKVTREQAAREAGEVAVSRALESLEASKAREEESCRKETACDAAATLAREVTTEEGLGRRGRRAPLTPTLILTLTLTLTLTIDGRCSKGCAGDADGRCQGQGAGGGRA